MQVLPKKDNYTQTDDVTIPVSASNKATSSINIKFSTLLPNGLC